MSRFKVAHIHKQNVDLIIIPRTYALTGKGKCGRSKMTVYSQEMTCERTL